MLEAKTTHRWLEGKDNDKGQILDEWFLQSIDNLPG